MAEGRTVLTAETMGKEKFSVINFRCIGCLATVWKLLAGSFTENMFESVEATGMFPQVQKRWSKSKSLSDRMQRLSY